MHSIHTFARSMAKLLQYTAAAYLLLLMLIKTMGMQIVVLDYRLHHDYIVANLCENRFDPEKNCAGRCYLEKQLGRNSDTGGDREEKGAPKTFSVDYFESIDAISFRLTPPVSVSPVLHRAARLPLIFPAAVFHPPLPSAA